MLYFLENLKYNHELVICDSELSQQAHKELFRFNAEAYLITDETTNVFDIILSTINSCNSTSGTYPTKIHLTLTWENLLRLSLWKATKPTTGDALTLLRNAGITSQELQLLRTADINDIFPYLYYGKQFNILRKICHTAKREMENHLKDRPIRVDCHLIADDTKRIVASSL